MELQLLSLNIGPVRIIGSQHGENVLSGIGKKPVTGEVFAGAHGITGDQQADLSVHGGNDKAIYAYPFEHWSWWQDEKNLACGPATFGENLTLVGAVESDVAIGDRFQWGDALLEISQPRAPCFKLAMHTDRPDVPGLMTLSARCGWYLRVLREGRAASGQALLRVHQSGGPSVRDSFVALHHSRADQALQRQVYAQPALARAWKIGLVKRLKNGDF